MSDPSPIQCPSCGAANVAVSPEGIVHCNACGSQFLPEANPPEDPGSPDILDYRTPVPIDDAELSELRIRNVSNLRRGAYRARSYWIIAAALCLMGALKLGQTAWVVGRRGWIVPALGDLLGAIAAAMLLVVCARKINALTREIHHSRLPDPSDPPDFSTLGDGSQRLRDLEAIAATHTFTSPPQSAEPSQTDCKEDHGPGSLKP